MTRTNGEKTATRKALVVATGSSRTSGYELRISSYSALGAAAGGDPVEETLHTGAFAPHEREEFGGVEVRGLVAEEGFHAPLDVGGGPGSEAVAFGDDPVVAEGVQHVALHIKVRGGGRIGASTSEVEAIKLAAMRGR